MNHFATNASVHLIRVNPLSSFSDRSTMSTSPLNLYIFQRLWILFVHRSIFVCLCY
jgi:hypothetical protein